MRIGTRLAGLSVILGVIVACGGEDGTKGDPGADGLPGADGESGQTALVNVVSGEPDECEHGGVIVEYGLDADDDAKLDASEVSGTKAICHGAEGADGEDGEMGPSGHSSLADVSAEPAGDNCEFGGQRLDLGTDLDDSGTLEDGEIASTSYVCNGDDGEDGEDGEDGAPGAVGEQGPSGTDGHDHLFSTSDEDPGSNCAAGGKRIDSGTDDDDDGVLDAAEIEATDYVCHGENGTDGHSALVAVTDEMAGANCAAGGERIDSGIDDDDSGTLEAPEVDDTDYVCDGTNGMNGTNGTSALVATASEAAGSNCAAGGTKVTFGQDDDGNSVLDAGEVDGTSYVCNGTAGFVTGFSGQIGPTFVGWTQCEGYRDAEASEDIPAAWGNDCVATQYTKVKLVCGASAGSYRYIDVNKNPFRDGLTSYPETGLITASKDQSGANFAITDNSIWADGNHPHNSVSWWAGGNGCAEAFTSVTVNNVCSFEAANCFGQNLGGDRYLWVYVQ